MKPNRLLFGVGLFLLSGATTGAQNGPVFLTCISDIVVSDAEDNTETEDNNLFVFSDALDLDEYIAGNVADKASLRWCFIEKSPGGSIEINGIGSNTSGNTLEPGAFNLRAISQWASIRNVRWSPTTGTMPYPAPGEYNMESLVELVVSDGTTTRSQFVTITTENVDWGPPYNWGLGDRLEGGTSEAAYTFTAGQEGWTWFGVWGLGIWPPTHNWSTGSLQMTEAAQPGNNDVIFGAWESPKNPALAVSLRLGCIVRGRFHVRSSVDGMTCPGFRCRAVTTHVMTYGGDLWYPDFLSQDFQSDLTVSYFTPDILGFLYVAGREPGTAGKVYDILSWPQQVDSLMSTTVITYFTCDLLDLDRYFSDDAGTIFVDAVEIDSVDRPEPGTGKPFPFLCFTDDFGVWTEYVGQVAGGGTHIAPSLTITANEIALNVQRGAQFFEASAVSPAVQLEVGRYYRAIFTVSSTAQPGGDFGPTVRCGFTSYLHCFSADKNLPGGGLLTAIGSTPQPFEVWMQAPPTRGKLTEPIGLRFQSWLESSNTGWPFNKNVSGTIRCTEVFTESFPPF